MSMEGDPPGGAFMPQQLAAIKDIVEDTLRPILSAMEHGHGGPSDLPDTSGTTTTIRTPGTGHRHRD